MYYVIIETGAGNFLAKCPIIIDTGDEAAFMFNGQPDSEHRGKVIAVMYVLKENDPSAVFARKAFGAEHPARVTAIFDRRDVEAEEASE